MAQFSQPGLLRGEVVGEGLTAKTSPGFRGWGAGRALSLKLRRSKVHRTK